MEDHTDMLVSYSKFPSATYIEDFGFQPSNLCGGTRRTPIDMYHLCCTVGQSHTHFHFPLSDTKSQKEANITFASVTSIRPGKN
jgi:hypothetical protein